MNEVQQAIAQAITDNIPYYDRDEILGAIADGVESAIWKMITNATSMPCIDFYSTVDAAVERAMVSVLSKKEINSKKETNPCPCPACAGLEG